VVLSFFLGQVVKLVVFQEEPLLRNQVIWLWHLTYLSHWGSHPKSESLRGNHIWLDPDCLLLALWPVESEELSIHVLLEGNINRIKIWQDIELALIMLFMIIVRSINLLESDKVSWEDLVGLSCWIRSKCHQKVVYRHHLRHDLSWKNLVVISFDTPWLNFTFINIHGLFVQLRLIQWMLAEVQRLHMALHVPLISFLVNV